MAEQLSTEETKALEVLRSVQPSRRNRQTVAVSPHGQTSTFFDTAAPW